MTSVADIVAGLDKALSKAREAVQHLRAAEQSWRESSAKLLGLLVGSQQDERRHIALFVTVAERKFDQVRTAILASTNHIEAYREQLVGQPAISPASDRYPPAAAWAAHLGDQPHSPNNSGV